RCGQFRNRKVCDEKGGSERQGDGSFVLTQYTPDAASCIGGVLLLQTARKNSEDGIYHVMFCIIGKFKYQL
ncbi:MAG: hypothetical protein RSG55_08660, partial [Oscillospiraceae bacterium]